MKHGSLFTGYGGLDIAVNRVFDATTAWVSDVDPGACKVLAHRFPDVPNLGDITKVNWADVEPVDILSGGSPCQDLSTAGRRAGMTDGTRSNLWVQMREAVNVLRPRFVVWENVRGATSATAASAMESDPGLLGDHPTGQPVLRALGRVLGDLADLGYDASWHGLRVSDIGGCHHRFRIFLVAYPHGEGLEGLHDPAGAASAERHGHAVSGAGRPGVVLPTPVADNSRGLPSTGTDFQSLPNVVCHLPLPSAVRATDWGKYGPAIESHTTLIGRPEPSPVELNKKGSHRLSPRFTEWMMGVPDGWIVDTPGVTRTEALRMAGNGVVPQQAIAALTHMINTMED